MQKYAWNRDNQRTRIKETYTCILKKRIVVCVFLISYDISKYIIKIFISFTKGTKYFRDLFHKREQ